jgi:hypothetical protein
VYEALSKGGHRVCRCGFDDQRNDRSLEVPTWMFEPAACDHLRLAGTPSVDGKALAELKTLLQTALRADVLQAQHQSLNTAGGADATVSNPSATLATDAISSFPATSAISGAPAGHPGQDDPAAGPTAPPAGRPRIRVSGEAQEARHE